jgi:hypothetical protein
MSVAHRVCVCLRFPGCGQCCCVPSGPSPSLQLKDGSGWLLTTVFDGDWYIPGSVQRFYITKDMYLT